MKITQSSPCVGTLNIGENGYVDSASTLSTVDVNNPTGYITDTSSSLTLSINPVGRVDYTSIGYVTDQSPIYDGSITGNSPYKWYWTVANPYLELPEDFGHQVVFKHTKKGKISIVLPTQVDINFPTAGWFNTEKKITVLQFKDGKTVKVSANPDKIKTNSQTGIIIALAKRILHKETLGDVYDRFGSDDAAEGYLFGIVEGYFVDHRIVPNIKYFNIWLSHFMTEVLVIQSKKVTQSKKKKNEKGVSGDLITEDQLDEILDKAEADIEALVSHYGKSTKKEDK